MLDINLIRENPKIVKDNLKKRYQQDKIKLLQDLIKKDEEWLKNKQKIDKLRYQRNIISKKINELKKQKKPAKEEIKEAKLFPKKIHLLEEKNNRLKEIIDKILFDLPNIIHKSVPLGKDEKDNKVIKKWGKVPKFKFKIKNHIDLIEELGIGDFTQSAIVSGSKFYYLKKELALLNQALIRFTIDHLLKKKYIYIETPLMLRKKAISGAIDFNEFEEQIYKIENEDLYLIGTAEHSILSYHANQTIKEEELPLKYFSYSMSFRKELGSHGIDEKGLFRTHQFNKVEQFIFCLPKDSYKYFNELLKNSEEILKKLELPYRVIEFCSGDLGNIKSKSYDLEVYMPFSKEYKEIGSLSNCTDYQTRRLNIKYEKKGSRELLYTLNNTAIATSRAMVAILENYQQKDGSVKVPKALIKYMNGIKIIK